MNFPTLLLRIKEVNYYKTKEEDQVHERSDLALILNNKELSLSCISLHLLESWTLHSNELSRNAEVLALEFPFSYPPISHPCTLLTVGTSEDEPVTSVRLQFNYTPLSPASSTSNLRLEILVTSVQCILTPG